MMFRRRNNADKSREDRLPRFVVGDGILDWAFKGRFGPDELRSEDHDSPFEERYLPVASVSFFIFDEGQEYTTVVNFYEEPTDIVRESIVMAYETIQDAKDVADS